MRPCSPLVFGRRDPHFDLVEPQHRGRHVLHHLACFDKRALRLTVTARENLDHVDAVQRKLERGRNRFNRETLAAARNPHQENALGHDFAAQTVAHLQTAFAAPAASS